MPNTWVLGAEAARLEKYSHLPTVYQTVTGCPA